MDSKEHRVVKTTKHERATLKRFLEPYKGKSMDLDVLISELQRQTTSSSIDEDITVSNRDIVSSGFNSIQKAWKQDFSGSSLDVFRLVVNDAEKNFSPENYAKFMPIIQSSGAGKSRLIDEYSKTAVGIIFTLRRDQQSRYPPGDIEVTELLRDSVYGREKRSTAHATIIAVLGSAVKLVLQELDKYYHKNKTTKGFAGYLHDRMAPSDATIPAGELEGWSAAAIAETRSEFRLQFCKKLVADADTLVQDFRQDSDWKEIFAKHPDIPYWDMASHALTVKFLIEPLTALVGRLPKTTKANRTPLFFAFDEVSNLEVEGKPTIYLALRRVCRLLSTLPVWTFVLSTQLPLDLSSHSFAPDPSAMVSKEERKSVIPFYAFPLDVEASRLLSADKDSQLSLSLDKLSEISHLVTLGRPLWLVNQGDSSVSVRAIAKDKLLCARKYNPESRDHLFAVLATRISLDPCIQSYEAVQLETQAVQSHLRWISEFDFKYGFFRTTSQSEPILAEAAASLLMEVNVVKEKRKLNWDRSIRNLYSELLFPGLIDRGRSGELITRLLCVRARDNVLHSMGESASATVPKYCRPFGVVDFIEALFTQSEPLLDSPAEVKNKNPQATIRTLFATASMNFSHFMATENPLAAKSTPELLHNLMFSQAALQLCPNQAHWDVLIPIYLGKRDESFDPKMLTAMLIQVKNSDRRNQFFVRRAEYEGLFSLENPIITILVDLGASKSAVDRIKSFSEKVFAFSISGAGISTYKCVTSKTASKTLAKILSLSDISESHAQSRVSAFNRRFGKHDWDGRFLEEYVEDKRKKKRMAEASDEGAVEETLMESQETSATQTAQEEVEVLEAVSKARKNKRKAKDASQTEEDDAAPEISQSPESSAGKQKHTGKARKGRSESCPEDVEDMKPAKKKRRN